MKQLIHKVRVRFESTFYFFFVFKKDSAWTPSTLVWTKPFLQCLGYGSLTLESTDCLVIDFYLLLVTVSLVHSFDLNELTFRVGGRSPRETLCVLNPHLGGPERLRLAHHDFSEAFFFIQVLS